MAIFDSPTVENMRQTEHNRLLPPGERTETARRRCRKRCKGINTYLSRAREVSLCSSVCRVIGNAGFYPLTPLTEAKVAGGSQ